MQIRLLEGPHGLEAAIYGMRLSWESHNKSDTVNGVVGKKDLELMKNLIKAGDSHSKFLRHIVVWLSIKATRLWWQQMATYRIGTEFQSSSTMHLWKRPLTSNDFEDVDEETIYKLNEYIKNEKFEKFKLNLPEGFLQERECMFSYQTLRRIYQQRINHKWYEWSTFIGFIAQLPYSTHLIMY